jgi:hypothetical protein
LVKEEKRQRSNVKYLKQINFDDCIPGNQYTASFDLTANNMRGAKVRTENLINSVQVEKLDR